MQIHLPGKQINVQVKPLTVKDINMLTDPSAMQNPETHNTILKSGLADKDIDPMDLIQGDRNALFIGIRRATYGNDYDVSLQCPACRTKQEFAVDLSAMEEKPGNQEAIQAFYDDPKNATFQYRFSDDVVANCKFLDGHDFKKQHALAKKKQDSLVTEGLLLQIKSLSGMKEGMQAKQYVNSMPAGELHDFLEFLGEQAPGIDNSVEVKCQNGFCGNEFDFQLPIDVGNFFKRSSKKKPSETSSST